MLVWQPAAGPESLLPLTALVVPSFYPPATPWLHFPSRQTSSLSSLNPLPSHAQRLRQSPNVLTPKRIKALKCGHRYDAILEFLLRLIPRSDLNAYVFKHATVVVYV